MIDPGLNENVDTIISGWGLTSGGGEFANFLQEITVSFLTKKLHENIVKFFYNKTRLGR